jgi:hypothetical protein
MANQNRRIPMRAENRNENHELMRPAFPETQKRKAAGFTGGLP